MIVLGIETSCDETAVSLIEFSAHNSDTAARILANEIISQIDIHASFGGVFPMMAKREHTKNLTPLLAKALEKIQNQPNSTKRTFSLTPELESRITTELSHESELATAFIAFLRTNPAIPNIDLISVTVGPGLEPALWVGVNFAKILSHIWNIPVYFANHMEGHIVSSLLPSDSFTTETNLLAPTLPALALLISGGHTELVLVESIGKYRLLGQTRDDAVGEAFDKVARILGLPYPGGPQVSKLAAAARLRSPEAHKFLPRPMINSGDYDFSFAGLKTAVLYHVQNLEKTSPLTQEQKEDIARDFEDACTEVLVKKVSNALEEFHIQQLIIGGGVIANTTIRNAFTNLCEQYSTLLSLPHKELTTDNALMIALVGFYHKEQASIYTYGSHSNVRAQGNLKLS